MIFHRFASKRHIVVCVCVLEARGSVVHVACGVLLFVLLVENDGGYIRRYLM